MALGVWRRLGHPILLPWCWLTVLERYYRELLAFLSRSVNDRGAAVDLVQESYTRVLTAQQSGQSIRDPRALLYRTARNLVIDMHRRSEVRMAADAVSLDDEEAGLDELAGPCSLEPETILASREGLEAVTSAIESLPLRCRETFILHKLDGLSYAEVAERMGVSTRTVEMQLRIAMNACWDRLDEINESDVYKAPRSRRQRSPP